ncbi:MAG: carboxypeptidase-like regulatory domain-containing protein [Bacteroidota bacterium]
MFTVKGQLLNSNTFEPIPFVSIYLKDEAIGTTSNENGDFMFHIPIEFKLHPIIISAMGYSSIEKMPNSFSENGKILLPAKTFNLNEVQLQGSADKVLKAKEIVRRAYDRISENYPNEPYILEGFVRDLQQEDAIYVEYLECAARFSYSGTHVKREPSVELLGVRTQRIAKKHPWNKNTERKNSLVDLVEDDFIRFDYGPILGGKGWKYEIKEILTYDNRLVYEIMATDPPFQTATLHIDAETFAFVRMELTRKAIKNRSWQKRFTNGALQVYYHVIFEYREYQGKMYLKYQKEEDHWRIFKGLESNKVLFTKYPKKELFINKIVTKNVSNYPFTPNMDIGASIEGQTTNYDMDFWSKYNIPERTEAQSTIIEELQGNTTSTNN